MLRALLELSRFANVPSIWTNCLAAWCIAGGDLGPVFFWTAAAASLVYMGGTFLNDAFDIKWDREHRPSRAIPSGRISAAAVWGIGGAMLVGGTAILILSPGTGNTSLIWPLALAAAVLLYDFIHKKTALGVVIMGACRYLLFIAAAEIAAPGSADKPWIHLIGAGTGLYIIGLSLTARGEATGGGAPAHGLVLLLAPLLVHLYALLEGRGYFMPVIAFAIFVGWLIYALKKLKKKSPTRIEDTVSRLLAGVVLIDLVTVSHTDLFLACIVIVAFLTSLVLQKVAPAT